MNNCRFCPYKTKCWEDTFKDNKEVVVNIILTDNKLKIKTDKFLQEKIDKVLDNKLQYEIDNKYYVVKAMKQKGIDFDGIIHLYRNSSTYLGFKNYIIELLQTDLKEFLEKKGYKLNIKIIDKRNIPNTSANINCKQLNGIELRDYQKEAIEHIIKDEISLTELSVGSGKTVMATEIIRRLNFKTLFVVDVSVLLKQTKDEFENLLGIECGLITNGEQNWKDINVATIQTIVKFIKNKDKEFMKNLRECNVVIVDEAHVSKSKSYNLLMENIRARYRIGLTGTAYSNGNDSLELYKSFGFPNFKITLKDLVDEGYLVKPIIKFVKYEHKEHYFDYDDAYNGCLNSEERLNKLKEIVEQHKDDNILIITRRLEHADKINEILGGNIEIIKGSLSKKKRDLYIKQMKEGKRNILIGSEKIVQKGLNIPNLNVLINYSANKGGIQTVQSLGRVIRSYEGKKFGYYYDFYDTDEYLILATKQRIKTLEQQGFDVEII
jgi:superfamily II DNA or RNA helicase